MKRFVLVSLCACITALSALAQPATSKAAASPQAAKVLPSDLPAAKVSAAFAKKQDSTRGKFDQIQALLSGIESRKVLRDGDSQNLDKLMFDYANELKAAFDQASRDADEAAKSNGQRGSSLSAKNFEDMAQQHEQVAKTFEPRVTQIQNKLKTGEIKPDRAALQKLSPSDLQEYRKSLTPSGLKEMERAHPDLMKPDSRGGLDRSKDQRLVAVAIPVPLLFQVDTMVGNFIDDLGPRSAEASLAAPCISSCAAKNWGACAACIVSKGPAAINAWNAFVSCWNGAGTCDWWHWGNCLRKAGCLYTLINKLA